MLPQKTVKTLRIPHKNKSLFLFQVNACSLKKRFDDLQYLLSCIKKSDVIISETRIAKQVSLLNNMNLNNYSDYTSTEAFADGNPSLHC